MATIIYKEDGIHDVSGTSGQEIAGIISTGRNVPSITFHNGTGLTTITGINPHVAGQYAIDISADDGAGANLRVGDTVTLTHDQRTIEEYVAEIEMINYTSSAITTGLPVGFTSLGGGNAIVRIDEVLDPLMYPLADAAEIVIDASSVGETSTTVTIQLPAGAPDVIPVGDVIEARASWTDEDGNEGLLLLHDTDYTGGHESLSVASGRIFTVTFSGTGAATLAAALADILDTTDAEAELTGRGYKGVDDETDNDFFNFEIVYHDSDRANRLSWSKDLKVFGNAVFPWTLPNTDFISCGEGTSAILING